MLYGIGFACVQKSFGTAAEAAIVQIEVTRQGTLKRRHVASEIGAGATTAQMLVAEPYLGRPVDEVEFAPPRLAANATSYQRTALLHAAGRRRPSGARSPLGSQFHLTAFSLEFRVLFYPCNTAGSQTAVASWLMESRVVHLRRCRWRAIHACCRFSGTGLG
ncbi:MAG: hypothetical protein ACRECW_04175 [Phyllobacterium sp.]